MLHCFDQKCCDECFFAVLSLCVPPTPRPAVHLVTRALYSIGQYLMNHQRTPPYYDYLQYYLSRNLTFNTRKILALGPDREIDSDFYYLFNDFLHTSREKPNESMFKFGTLTNRL